MAFFLNARAGVKLKLAICAALALGTVTVSGIFIFELVRLNATATPRKVVMARHHVENAPPFTYPYEIKDLSLTFPSRNNRRIASAQFTLVLDCPNRESLHAMELYRAKLLDLVIEVSAGFHAEDFDSPRGFDAFKKALHSEMAGYFKQYSPRAVVLRDWLVD